MSQGQAPVGSVGLVGRERELAVLDDLLAREGPTLVLIAAPVGMGKTSLLQALRAHAGEVQRLVLPHPGEQPLVGPDSTPQSVAERLGRRLDDVVPSARSGLQGSGRSPLTANHPGGRTAADDGVAAAKEAATKPQDPAALASKLGQAARTVSLLLVVDDYWPSPDFAGWLADEFLPRLLEGTGTDHTRRIMVVIAASRDEDVEALSRLATTVLELGPLDSDTVAAHFRSIGGRLQPPPTDVELDVYATAAREAPQLLEPLTRTLLLARSSESTEASR